MMIIISIDLSNEIAVKLKTFAIVHSFSINYVSMNCAEWKLKNSNLPKIQIIQ